MLGWIAAPHQEADGPVVLMLVLGAAPASDRGPERAGCTGLVRAGAVGSSWTSCEGGMVPTVATVEATEEASQRAR